MFINSQYEGIIFNLCVFKKLLVARKKTVKIKNKKCNIKFYVTRGAWMAQFVVQLLLVSAEVIFAGS